MQAARGKAGTPWKLAGPQPKMREATPGSPGLGRESEKGTASVAGAAKGQRPRAGPRASASSSSRCHRLSKYPFL